MPAEETFCLNFLIPDYMGIVYCVNDPPLPVHAYCLIYCKVFMGVSSAHYASSVKTCHWIFSLCRSHRWKLLALLQDVHSEPWRDTGLPGLQRHTEAPQSYGEDSGHC